MSETTIFTFSPAFLSLAASPKLLNRCNYTIPEKVIKAKNGAGKSYLQIAGEMVEFAEDFRQG